MVAFVGNLFLTVMRMIRIVGELSGANVLDMCLVEGGSLIIQYMSNVRIRARGCWPSSSRPSAFLFSTSGSSHSSSSTNGRFFDISDFAHLKF